MYSAVLMLALTAGGESVDFGRNRCNACSSACSATAAKACTTTTKSSCASSCSTRHRLFGNRCSTSCSTSSACTKTVVAAAPACSKSHGCSASRCSGGGLFSRLHNRCSSSCAVSTGCSTTTAPKKEMPKGEKVAPPKTDKKVSATIVVSLPADARLIVEGAPTTSTSERRTLVTPELDFGSTYVYTVRAEVVQNGQIVAQTQEVLVRGGETASVQFNFSTQGIASR
jgi:uncharacterized protein (TIGR03000 family)